MQHPLRCVLLVAGSLVLRSLSSAHAWTAESTTTAPEIPGIEKVQVGVGLWSTTYPEPFASNSTLVVPLFSYVIQNPIAQFIRVHFSSFSLPSTDFVIIKPTNPADNETRSFTYHGDGANTSFLADVLYTNSVTVELYAMTSNPTNDPPNKGFMIDNYRYLASAASFTGSAQEEVCGADDTNEAACFQMYPDAFKRSKAVIRLLISKPSGNFFCTGWLVGCEGHVLTNNHCIGSQDHASRTDFEFGAQSDTCAVRCNSPFGCKGKVRAKTATLVVTNPDLDYTLVKLDDNLSNEYGYLQMRESGAVMDERIYIPQHPGGWGKRIAMKDGENWGKVSSLTQGGCLPNQVGYSLDTQGGSSGSPLLGWSDNAVVAIHHCGGCPNAAVNMRDVVADLRLKGLLPRCALL